MDTALEELVKVLAEIAVAEYIADQEKRPETKEKPFQRASSHEFR